MIYVNIYSAHIVVPSNSGSQLSDGLNFCVWILELCRLAEQEGLEPRVLQLHLFHVLQMLMSSTMYVTLSYDL